MTALLDTSVVIRYLTGEPRALAARAASIIDTVDLVLTDVVIAESAFVLGSVYHVPRAEIVDTLIELVRKENLAVWNLDKAVVVEALLLCRTSNRVSYADAMLWAVARVGGQPVVYSFDERFPAAGVSLRREA